MIHNINKTKGEINPQEQLISLKPTNHPFETPSNTWTTTGKCSRTENPQETLNLGDSSVPLDPTQEPQAIR